MDEDIQNFEKAFPELNLAGLKLYVPEWIERRPHLDIERIVLYYSSPSPCSPRKNFEEPWRYLPHVYTVVLECSKIDTKKAAELRDLGTFQYPFIDAAFGKIAYKEPRPVTTKENDFRREWTLMIEGVTTHKDKNITISADIEIKKDGPSWVLWDKSDAQLKEVESPNLKTETEIVEPETFIRNLRISQECDYEIKIQLPGRKPEIHTCETLGFRNHNTKEWKTFLGILQNHRHLFYAGLSYRKSSPIEKRDYDANQKILRKINKKLIVWLNRQYQAQIPESFKLYEHTGEMGIYRFLFCSPTMYESMMAKNKEQAEFEGISKEELIREIKRLGSEYEAILKSVKKEDWDREKKLSLALKVKKKLEVAVRQAKTTGISKEEIPPDLLSRINPNY